MPGLGQEFDVIIGVDVGARPIRLGRVSQPSRFVKVDVKPVELGMSAWRRGAVGAAEKGGRKTKRRDGSPTVACDKRCISSVGEDDQFIDRDVLRRPGNKSGAGSG